MTRIYKRRREDVLPTPRSALRTRYVRVLVLCNSHHRQVIAAHDFTHKDHIRFGRLRRQRTDYDPVDGCGLSRDVTTKSVRSVTHCEQRNRSSVSGTSPRPAATSACRSASACVGEVYPNRRGHGSTWSRTRLLLAPNQRADRRHHTAS